jgi:hypothetical protein
LRSPLLQDFRFRGRFQAASRSHSRSMPRLTAVTTASVRSRTPSLS